MPVRGQYSAPPPDLEATGGDEGPGVGSALAGAAALGVGALAARNPALARSALGKLGRVLMGTRYGAMLSGLAVPKSILGNVGAATTAAIERRSLEPLKTFFRPQTARTFFRELRRPGVTEGAQGNLFKTTTGGAQAFGEPVGRLNPFGRVMGAGDTATREALKEAGLTEAEALRLTLQSPEYIAAGAKMGLETLPGRIAVPFRRTGFNQFFGGLRAMAERPGIAAGYGATGAALGANEDIDPRTLGLLAPLASIYTLPFILGAAATRSRVKPSDLMKVIGGASPVSEYGLASLVDPTRPFRKPAALSALEYLRGN